MTTEKFFATEFRTLLHEWQKVVRLKGFFVEFSYTTRRTPEGGISFPDNMLGDVHISALAHIPDHPTTQPKLRMPLLVNPLSTIKRLRTLLGSDVIVTEPSLKIESSLWLRWSDDNEEVLGQLGKTMKFDLMFRLTAKEAPRGRSRAKTAQ